MNGADEILDPALGRVGPDHPAILYGDEVVSYDVLRGRVNQAGHALRRLGLGRQDRMVMMVHDSPAFFYAYLGAMKIGAVPIALNLRSAANDLLFAINDSACRIVLLDQEFLPLHDLIAGSVAHQAEVVVVSGATDGSVDLTAAMVAMPEVLEPESISDSEMAFWMYTSGTTGSPKGAVHGPGSIHASDRFLGQVLNVGPGDRLF